MRDPKPIRVTGTGGLTILKVSSPRWTKAGRPYLSVSTGSAESYGYIEDRDVRRLMAWCKDCLEGKKK